MNQNKKCYISGPIAGYRRDEVEGAFGAMAKNLRALGIEPVSPLQNGLPAESTWEEHMRADIKLLVDCDYIIMLDGWADSRGARIELNLARGLGIRNITSAPIDTI